MNPLYQLVQLDTDNFIAAISTVEGRHFALSQHPVILEVAAKIRSGEIADEDIYRFVESQLKDFQVGKIFPHSIALSGLIVAGSTFHSSACKQLRTMFAENKQPEFRIPAMTAQKIVARQSNLHSDTRLTKAVREVHPTSGMSFFKPRVLSSKPHPSKDDIYALAKWEEACHGPA